MNISQTWDPSYVTKGVTSSSPPFKGGSPTPVSNNHPGLPSLHLPKTPPKPTRRWAPLWAMWPWRTWCADFFGTCCKIRWIWGSKPMSNIRSASSKTWGMMQKSYMGQHLILGVGFDDFRCSKIISSSFRWCEAEDWATHLFFISKKQTPMILVAIFDKRPTSALDSPEIRRSS